MNSLLKILRDPIVLVNRIYYWGTGISIRTLQDKSMVFDETLRSLTDLAERDRVEPTKKAEDFVSEDSYELAEVLTRHGSDKATKHNYHLVYANLLEGKRNLPLRILEIGICTSFIEAPTHTDKDGIPGPSLRAWREWGNGFSVFGADINENYLFTDERIATYKVDQTSLYSLGKLADALGKESLDLIIDDGLHRPWANLNTLNFALDMLKKGGHLVIEDIREEYESLWKVAACLLPGGFKGEIVQTRNEALMFICTRL